MTRPIRKSITVPLPADQAFDLFTAEIDSWWPKDRHSVAAQQGSAALAVRVEPREGGHIVELCPDGSEAEWATITAWEPGHRLSVDWYPGRTREEATVLEVTFHPTEAGTRVDLVHGGFDRFGAEAETMSGHYSSGWDFVLGDCFGGACRKSAA